MVDFNRVRPNLHFRRILNASPTTEAWNPLFDSSNFRFRRILKRSPMVEVKRVEGGREEIMRGGWEQALSSRSITSSPGVVTV